MIIGDVMSCHRGFKIGTCLPEGELLGDVTCSSRRLQIFVLFVQILNLVLDGDQPESISEDIICKQSVSIKMHTEVFIPYLFQFF